MSILDNRTVYKPFQYPWAYDYFKQQQQMHWGPEEVPLKDDVSDWNNKLVEEERHLLTQLFRFFTQGDVDIAEAYCDRYIPLLGGHPEVRMMLMAFSNMEGVHQDAYSHLLDTLGLPEVEYSAFLEYEAMANKHEFLHRDRPAEGTVTEDTLLELAEYSAFTEGLQLFSSFAILLNFTRFGKMTGMGQIVTWSVRDESLHVEGMIKVFHTLVEENPEIWKDEFKAKIYESCRRMVELEDSFIDLCFEQGGIEGLEPEEVKQYIRYIADRRLLQLGLKPNYGVKDNPLPWLDEILNGVEHANFFETRATEYSKASLQGEIRWA